MTVRGSIGLAASGLAAVLMLTVSGCSSQTNGTPFNVGGAPNSPAGPSPVSPTGPSTPAAPTTHAPTTHPPTTSPATGTTGDAGLSGNFCTDLNKTETSPVATPADRQRLAEKWRGLVDEAPDSIKDAVSEVADFYASLATGKNIDPKSVATNTEKIAEYYAKHCVG